MTPHLVQRGEPPSYLMRLIFLQLFFDRLPLVEPLALAMNYAKIGAIIGHEISHAFDDQGALFDAEGRYKELVDARRLCPLPGSGGTS